MLGPHAGRACPTGAGPQQRHRTYQPAEDPLSGTETLSRRSRPPLSAITDNGPDNYAVAAGGTVNPFAGLAVTDGASLHEVVTVTVTGGGTLSDPTAGTDAKFTGGVFTESGDNLNATDYAQTILRRLVYTAPSPATNASFNVEVDNSLQGSATNNNITVGPGHTITFSEGSHGVGCWYRLSRTPVTQGGYHGRGGV